MLIVKTLISALVGYAFGCIQSAYLVGKIFGKLDIREFGSGNAGASNVTAIMGIKFGIFVGITDILKGVFAVLIVKWIYPENPELAFLSGLMAVIGHIFPFYMRLKGGKGVATLVGMMIGVNWKLGLLFFLLVAVLALVTDYIVVGSLSSFTALPIVTFFQEYPLMILVISIFLALLSFYLHRSNLQRIRDGEELRVRATIFRKKPEGG